MNYLTTATDRSFLKASHLVLSFLVLLLSSISNAQVPQLAVYRWGAPNAPASVDTYASWLNRPDIWAEDFLPQATWTDIQWPGWMTQPWRTWLNARAGRKLLLGVPMLPNSVSGVSLAQGAAGAYDVYFRDFATDLVNKGIAERVIIRLGWEFNGGWYRWAAAQDQPSWINYWRRIVTVMRSVPGGGASIKFCFNPAIGWLQIRPDQVYPGDAYVDYIALDCYDECYFPDTYPWPAGSSAAEILRRRTNAWNIYQYGDYGLNFWQNFAAQHGKGFGIGEWGVNDKVDNGLVRGGLDNDYYIQKMYDYLTTHPIAFACYFDVQAPDGHHQLSPPVTQFPLAAARFHQLFSGTSSSSTIVLDNAGTGVTRIGSWTNSTSAAGFYGADYIHDENTGKGSKSVTFTPSIPTSGTYAVYARWTAAPNRASTVPITITHAGGATTVVYVNQQTNNNTWVLLATRTFEAGTAGNIRISNGGTSGYVIADAVQLIRQ